MRTQRSYVAKLDRLLGKRINVLDDGFVRVVDYMGSDSAIVQAARISYGAGTKRSQSDRGLIRYLMRHSHTTPFEMCEIKFHIRAPMDCWRQWIRHRTASVNEYSTRYSEAIDAAQRTPPSRWRTQSTTNKQGSGQYLPVSQGKQLTAQERTLHDVARREYSQRLAIGVAREQARKDLPLSTYTEAYWKIDLHNLLHFLQLRMDSHAQAEIREYAIAIGKQVVSRWTPIAWEAFVDYRLNAMRLSRLELEIVSAISRNDLRNARKIALANGLLKRSGDGALASNGERRDLEMKLATLGLLPPWK